MFSIVPRLLNEMAPMMRFADEFARYPLIALDKNIAQVLSQYGETEVHNTDKEVRIRMDLQHFKPEEVKISSDNKKITVSAKHEEKQDNHGFVAREITRMYKLPEDVDPQSITSSMNAHGVLSIKIQKKAIGEPKETQIPIDFKS
ncbi:heat shock protein Hsp-12.2-like [Physella acuta]|uniref:heat shock protein Hsp-12.2-like n=1 Tax=Physella acuta TaxID=109671 RepID=UPI0027DCB989|nr:heat shock protein Hsp-12.2-like [Physella acuta]XP_059162915.1 heat shock protein Hsp-12.2-like [Physella acuta]XP_059162916.1 heat shock protein Hsp-12.2-like [Physella acuta]XP_059162917.1 heat shock protein Hsp-12.2-like [Physella acuta]